MKAIDEVAAELAARQHGAFTGRQVGGSRSAHARRIANGQWRRTLCTGVFVLAGSAASWRQRLSVAILAAPEGSVASHRSAAVLHGFGEGTPIEITAPRGAHARPAVGVVHQSGVDARQRTTIDGIPATKMERTLVDLAAVTGDGAVEQAVEAVLRRRLTTVDRIIPELATSRPGVVRLRRVLERRGGGPPAGSELEVLLIRLLRAAGLPTPVRQHEVCAGAARYFLDLAYPDRRLGIELDGREWHEGAAFQRDRTRQNALVLAGWTVLRFTWADVTERPVETVALVNQALRAA